MDEDSEMQQLKTNYLGPMSLIRMVLPTMREKGYGHIINVSSVSGMLAMPTMGSYSASKHALDGASEALWYEMKPFGIKVSVVQPGFVHSNSFKNVYLSRKAQFSGDLEGPYAEYYTYIAPFIERLMRWSRSTPDKIARKIFGLMESRRPPLWKTATPDAFLFGMLRKFLPKRIFHKIMFLMLPGSKKWGGQFSRIKDRKVS
jgi:short-subunit dehydrogenase